MIVPFSVEWIAIESFNLTVLPRTSRRQGLNVEPIHMRRLFSQEVIEANKKNQNSMNGVVN